MGDPVSLALILVIGVFLLCLVILLPRDPLVRRCRSRRGRSSNEKNVNGSIMSGIRGRELGRRLLEAQRKAGFNGSDLAVKMGWTGSTLSRTMTGHRVVREIEVASLLGLCAVPGPEHEQLMSLSRPYEDCSLHLTPDEAWSTYVMYARDAIRLVEFEPVIVPWPVQIPEYTAAVLADGPTTAAQEATISARREAVSLLGLPSVVLVVDEWALRNPVGDESMMSEQLHHLLRISVRPSLSLQVVPVGHGPRIGRCGAFTVLDYARHPPLLYREDVAEGVLSDDDRVAGPHRSTLTALMAAALDQQRSRDLIARIALEQYGGRDDRHQALGA